MVNFTHFGSKTNHISRFITLYLCKNAIVIVYIYMIIVVLYQIFFFLSFHSAFSDLFSLSFHDYLLCPKKEERRRGKRKTKSSPPQPYSIATQHHPSTHYPLQQIIIIQTQNQPKINGNQIKINSKLSQTKLKINQKHNQLKTKPNGKPKSTQTLSRCYQDMCDLMLGTYVIFMNHQ